MLQSFLISSSPRSTGQCISRFTNRKVPYCVKFNPDEEKQSLFVAGMSDKKIVQVGLLPALSLRGPLCSQDKHSGVCVAGAWGSEADGTRAKPLITASIWVKEKARGTFCDLKSRNTIQAWTSTDESLKKYSLMIWRGAAGPKFVS